MFAMHEVYYDDDGKPKGWTGPIHLDGYESVEALAEDLCLMLADIEHRAVLSVLADGELVEAPPEKEPEDAASPEQAHRHNPA